MNYTKSYRNQTDIENTLKLREVLKTLPKFASDFFRGVSTTTATSTRIKYAYDIRIFFQYISEQNPIYKNKELTSFPISVLDEITALDLEEYIEYLKAYKPADSDDYVTNGEKGIKRKLSALRAFYAYYYKRELIKTNPTLLIDMPKLHQKEIIRLDADEVSALLDFIENGGEKMSEHQRKYLEKTKVRDLAIITLLLGTGVRVSECVGLDINDVDFRNGAIKVTRKGGNEMFVYFGDEVEKALLEYMEERKNIIADEKSENALFLSSQKKRISVKAVENLVKKYSSYITSTKKITPHKLRSTYGTALYQETGDIYLVADVLGHKDVNTTKRHYAAMSDMQRRKAANAVKLRED
jgi:integrase/recombinase XerC